MEMVNLEDVCEVIAGQSPPSENYNQNGKGLPFFQGKADFNDLFPTVRYWCDKPTKIAMPNDVLLSVRAPVGPTNLCNKESCIGRGLTAIRAGKKVDHRYLLYFFRSIEERLRNQGRGSTFSAITQSEIKEIKFPLIQLLQQQKIASILEQADAARQKRKQANQLTEEFLQSAFHEMFGNPMRNERKWEVRELSAVCKKVADGTHFSPTNSNSGEYKYITAKNIKKHGFDFSSLTYIDEIAHRDIYRRCNPELGDVLYIKDGVTTGIAMVNTLNEEFSLLSSVALFKLKSEINSQYLVHYLNNPSVYDSIRKSMGGAAITRLTVEKLKRIKIVLPPLSLQQKFADIIKQIEQLRNKQRESEKNLDNLFGSLMQRYFG